MQPATAKKHNTVDDEDKAPQDEVKKVEAALVDVTEEIKKAKDKVEELENTEPQADQAEKVYERWKVRFNAATEELKALRQKDDGLRQEKNLLIKQRQDGNRLPMTRRNGEGSGNWAQFKLSGPTQQGVEQLLLVDTGSDPADLIITTSLAATLGLGTPERRERRITGASGRPLNLVDYPTMTRVTLTMPNGTEKKAMLATSSLVADSPTGLSSDEVPTIPAKFLLGHTGQHKLGIKLDMENYTIHELAEDEDVDEI